MASKSTQGAAAALVALLVTQALAGDWFAALLAAAALGAGGYGYLRDKSTVGKLIDKVRR